MLLTPPLCASKGVWICLLYPPFNSLKKAVGSLSAFPSLEEPNSQPLLCLMCPKPPAISVTFKAGTKWCICLKFLPGHQVPFSSTWIPVSEFLLLWNLAILWAAQEGCAPWLSLTAQRSCWWEHARNQIKRLLMLLKLKKPQKTKTNNNKKTGFSWVFCWFHFSLNQFLGVVHQRVVEPFFLEVFSVFP